MKSLKNDIRGGAKNGTVHAVVTNMCYASDIYEVSETVAAFMLGTRAFTGYVVKDLWLDPTGEADLLNEIPTLTKEAVNAIKSACIRGTRVYLIYKDIPWIERSMHAFNSAFDLNVLKKTITEDDRKKVNKILKKYNYSV